MKNQYLGWVFIVCVACFSIFVWIDEVFKTFGIFDEAGTPTLVLTLNMAIITILVMMSNTLTSIKNGIEHLPKDMENLLLKKSEK